MSRRKSSRAPRRNKAENIESSVPPPVAAEAAAPVQSFIGETPSDVTHAETPPSELDLLDAGWD
jgi:hypothetical protein